MSTYASKIFERMNALYHVSPSDLLYWRPYDESRPLPQPGETISMGDGYEYQQYAAKDSMPDLIRVPVTTWGDYAGDSVQRSNCEALFEDFPQFFIMTSGGWDSHYLLLPTYWEPSPEDENPEGSLDNVLDIIKGISEDYPLYDEQHHSNLEVEAATEAWGQFLYADMRNQMSRKHGVDSDVFEAVDETKLQNAWWDLDRLQDSSPYLEDAVNVVFPYFDQMVADLVPFVVTEGYRALIKEARGQHGLVKHLRDERKSIFHTVEAKENAR